MGADIQSDESEMPESLRYLFDVFMKLKFSRVPNEDGVLLVAREVLDCHHIDFYSKHTGLDFEWWEVEAILSLDAIFERSAR
jgi:hypothetical protein